ncbi:hypothetical protein ACH5RR_006956 [Cinchona calisaya]|uniref:Uncharacterized protein n=1 Tax=Cinchona calisaya TaxID=153742 RepID=A0ABD3AQK1_9GENT
MPIEVNETEDSVQIIKGPNMVNRVVLTKPYTELAYHLKPLFVQGHLNGILVARMMVDNGTVVNILPARMMKLGKSIEDLIPKDIVVINFTVGVRIHRGSCL